MKPNQYTCPNCGANLAIDVEHLDKPMNCPFCDSPITAPTDVLNTVIAEKEETKRNVLEAERGDKLASLFRSQMPTGEKLEFHVEVQALGEDQLPVILTQSEYMRRMKDMSRIQAGMSFYGEMPAMYSVTVNSDHPLIKKVLADKEANANIVSQLIDLALLEGGMLKGEALAAFIKRSQEMLG